MQLPWTVRRNIQQETPNGTVSYFCQDRKTQANFFGSAQGSCHQAPGLGDLTCGAAAEERPVQLCTKQSIKACCSCPDAPCSSTYLHFSSITQVLKGFITNWLSIAHRYKVAGDGTQEHVRPMRLSVNTMSAFVIQAYFPVHSSQYLLAL